MAKVFVMTVSAAGSLAAGGLLWIGSSADASWALSPAHTISSRQKHAVVVRPGPATPVIKSGARTHAGTLSDVSCATCHTTRPADAGTHSSAQLDQFHQGLIYQHGELSCLSCHNAGNYDTLKKADGSAVQYPATIQLCAQCHGPQYRDFRHGSHGGMTGFWDLSRGPRERNTCTDCHDPHAPAFPKVMPVFPPADAGARQQQSRNSAANPHP